MLDEVMPGFDVSERHEIRVAAGPDAAYRAVRNLDLGRSIPIMVLFVLRGLPNLLTGKARLSSSLTLDDLLDMGFVVLREDPGREIVLGVVGRFWRPDGGIEPVPAEGFVDFDELGFAKATMNFRVERVWSSGSLVVTETRVLCTDGSARRRFLRYWKLVGPFSALIRRLLLQGIKRSVESASPA